MAGRPHQPCPSCHGPRCGPYVFRSKISAPMLQLESGVTSLSSPRLQPGSVRSGQLAVPTAQAINPPGSAWPKGRSMLCWSPAASASAETVGVLRPSNWFTPTPRVRHQAALPVVVDGASRTTGRHRSQPRRGQVALPTGQRRWMVEPVTVRCRWASHVSSGGAHGRRPLMPVTRRAFPGRAARLSVVVSTARTSCLSTPQGSAARRAGPDWARGSRAACRCWRGSGRCTRPGRSSRAAASRRPSSTCSPGPVVDASAGCASPAPSGPTPTEPSA